MLGEEIYKQISSMRSMLGEYYLDEDSREKLVKYIESLRDSQCQTVDDVKPEITISMDEYKELLIIKGRYEIIKGRYEELNSRTLIPQIRYPYTGVTYRSFDEENINSDDRVEPESI